MHATIISFPSTIVYFNHFHGKGLRSILRTADHAPYASIRPFPRSPQERTQAFPSSEGVETMMVETATVYSVMVETAMVETEGNILESGCYVVVIKLP